MSQLTLWCISSVLMGVGTLILLLALLRAGGQNRFHNKRIAEIIWQARNPNTDWWLEINKKDQ